MKKLTALSLALFSLSLAPAAVSASDGYYLLTKLKQCDRNLDYSCGFAQGYISGFFNTLQINYLCVPVGTRIEQPIAVVKKFLEDNPARQHEDLSVLVVEAFSSTWKCPTSK